MKNKGVKTSEEILKEQDRMIGEMTRKINYLEDSQQRRDEWLSKAKKEAGYDRMESFDNVWKEVLSKSKALESAEARIKELEEENEKLKIKNVNERFKLQQSYREQFDWIAKHYPECYKNIPNPVEASELFKEFREEIKRKDQLIKDAYFQEHQQLDNPNPEVIELCWIGWAGINNIEP